MNYSTAGRGWLLAPTRSTSPLISGRAGGQEPGPEGGPAGLDRTRPGRKSRRIVS